MSRRFHGLINNKRNRSRINGLNIQGVWVTEPPLIKNHVYNSFKDKFHEAFPSRPKFSSNLFKQLSPEDSTYLDLPFSIQEIKDAVWNCGGDKAPGPDGFTFKLFKKHWDVIGGDVISYVKEFEASGVIPKGCNSSFITLIPKSRDPLTLNDFRPISLIGCQYKIIAKILASRLAKVASSVVGDVQMAFLKDRQIIDGPLIVDEIFSWAKTYKRKLFILKVDFEKAFDLLNWEFLDSIMFQMGFSSKWRNRISACLNSAYSSILVNGSPTPEFKLEKGLRQGDPLSPFLFILAVEALNVALVEAKNILLFKGIEVGKDKVHVSHLQFADDAIIMGEWSTTNVRNLSSILTCFHIASGLKVNFLKSRLFGIGVNESDLTSLASSIGCQPSHFPCTYLGLPIGANMSKNANWSPLVDRFLNRLSNWKAKSLSFGGRLTLTKSVLGSLGVYYFSTFKAPKSIIKKLECIRRKFFWGGSTDNNKIAWISWNKVMASLDQCGLNIGSLHTSNLSMLAKWWWRFLTERSSNWCKIICSIHGAQGGLHNSSSIKSKSGPWYQIAKINGDFSEYGIDIHSLFKLKIGNGESSSFWTDKWVGNEPLCVTFPRLYRLETNKLCHVKDRIPTLVVPAHAHASFPSVNPSTVDVDQTFVGQHPLNPPG